MRRVFDDFKDRLTKFVEQRDRPALVLDAPDDEALLVLKCVEELDDTRSSELFWVHSDPFRDAASWIAGVADRFALVHGGVSMSLEAEGGEPWPPLPPEVLDEELEPHVRLRAVLSFSRDLVPDPEEGVSVCVLWPLEVDDPHGWAGLLGDLLPHEFPAPWCRRLRIVARGLPGDLALDQALARIPRIAREPAGLGQEAMHAALDAEASDSTLPVPRRLLSLLISANADTSHGRPKDALRKYEVLLDYHMKVRDPTMTALVLNGVGEAQRRLGNSGAARQAFEAATRPAAASEYPPIPVLLNVTLNLANQSLEEERWKDAEGYYDAAQQFAALQRDARTRVSAMENLGVCRYMLRDPEGAEEVWRAGAEVSGTLELPEAQVRFLYRLRGYYAAVSDVASQADVEGQLAALGVPVPPGVK